MVMNERESEERKCEYHRYLICTNAFSAEDFRLEPRQIVDADAVLFARNSDENVLTFKHLHLLESTPRYQLIYFTLTTPIQ